MVGQTKHFASGRSAQAEAGEWHKSPKIVRIPGGFIVLTPVLIHITFFIASQVTGNDETTTKTFQNTSEHTSNKFIIEVSQRVGLYLLYLLQPYLRLR